MKCEKIMLEFDSLDNGQNTPLGMKLHFVFCPECRKKAALMKSELAKLENQYLYKMNRSISGNVMRILHLSANKYNIRPGYMGWAAAGVIIFLSRFAVSYSDSHIWLNSYFGDSLALPLNLVLGAAITIYATVFIITNLDDIKRRSHLK